MLEYIMLDYIRIINSEGFYDYCLKIDRQMDTKYYFEHKNETGKYH